jgi:hypothetical protein
MSKLVFMVVCVRGGGLEEVWGRGRWLGERGKGCRVVKEAEESQEVSSKHGRLKTIRPREGSCATHHTLVQSYF